MMAPMDWTGREVVTAVLTGLSAPVGAIGLAFGLASWASTVDDTGWGTLAAVIAGLLFGGPLLSFTVFLIRLAISHRTLAHPWRAAGIMAVACLLTVIATFLWIALSGRIDGQPLTWIALPLVPLALAAGAALALRWSSAPHLSPPQV